MVMVKVPKKSIMVVNKIPSWLRSKGMDRQDFVSIVAAAGIEVDGKRPAVDTIERVADGDTNLNLRTAIAIAASLGESLEALFGYEKG